MTYPPEKKKKSFDQKSFIMMGLLLTMIRELPDVLIRYAKQFVMSSDV